MLEHCYEAAIELEKTFDMAQVIELRLPETMESINEILKVHGFREQVAGALPQFKSNEDIRPEYA